MLLVTGITGHSGSYFLKELINNKYEGPIRCVVRETSDTSLIDNSGLHIEKVVGAY
jgi:thioester reductase-like protein